MKYLLAFLLLFSTSVHADKLILGGFSHHFEDLWYKPNETHPAIGYEWSTWEVSAYKNTLKKTSLAVAYIDRPWEWKGLDMGYRFGLASGYSSTYGKDPKKKGTRVEHLKYKEKEGWRYGIAPQAQFIITADYKALSVDFGIGHVATLVFKVRLSPDS